MKNLFQRFFGCLTESVNNNDRYALGQERHAALVKTLKYREIVYEGIAYQWSAIQDSEQPSFLLQCDGGELWVQVEIGLFDKSHHRIYASGKADFPISDSTVSKIVSKVVYLGYLKSYFEKDIGLVFTEEGQLIEN